ncbi:hypothetical protein DdX_09725 [Ditylenchus destructor]|uniref:Uncharacterized protein n=1 Tax=Ditylenchus destructor TaxID=166010 RepID=A0AAD4N1Y5_9BILA|nr:hypothetical protein DdX_09725 [Ditylenchus destructor]
MASLLTSACVLMIVANIVAVLGRPQGPPSGGQFPGMPPELESVLPAETVTALKAIHTDPSLNFQQKQEQIDKMMVQLPVEILDKIPTPPGFDQLPEEVRNRIKSINRNKDKAWAEKQTELQQYVQSLPADQKALLMGPMQG